MDKSELKLRLAFMGISESKDEIISEWLRSNGKEVNTDTIEAVKDNLSK